MRRICKAILPAKFDSYIKASLIALHAGVANEGQQKAAMKWIIKKASGIGTMSFDPENDSATCFAEGKRFVGQQILWVVNEDPETENRKADDG